LSQERLGRLNAETLVYNLRKPTVDGRRELILTLHELLDRLVQLVPRHGCTSTNTAEFWSPMQS
jgi:hypothetical protein